MTKTLIGSALVLIAGYGLYFMPVSIELPWKLEEVLRGVVILQTGFAIGLVLGIIQCIGEATISRKGLLRMIRLSAMAMIGTAAFVMFESYERLKIPFVTWRAPYALMVFAIGDIGLYGIWHNIRSLQRTNGSLVISFGKAVPSAPHSE